MQFYGYPDKKAVIFALPFEPAPEVAGRGIRPVASTGRVLEHWHSGSMTAACRSSIARSPTRSATCIRRMRAPRICAAATMCG